MLSKRVINLASLALFLALAENFIPRPLPFFRLGLSNIPLLLAISSLSFKEYSLLIILKAFSSSYLSATLFSPFFLMSLFQSIASGYAMLLLKKALKERVSIYGLSMAGAFFSAIVQVHFASLMLGNGILTLLPIMLIISFFSSIITAYLSKKIDYDFEKEIPKAEKSEIDIKYTLFLFLIILLSSTLKSPLLLFIAFLISISATIFLKRRFKIMNYLFLIALSLFSSLITPRGEVLFRIFSLPISRIALSEGLENGLRLSLMMALSLTLSRFLIKGGPLSLILNKFFSMESAFYSDGGNIKQKVRAALNADYIDNVKNSTNKKPYFILIFFLTVLIILNLIELSIF